jgi:hypothetical protein
MRLTGRMHTHVITRGIHPIDIVKSQELHAIALAYGQTVHGCLCAAVSALSQGSGTPGTGSRGVRYRAEYSAFRQRLQTILAR